MTEPTAFDQVNPCIDISAPFATPDANTARNHRFLMTALPQAAALLAVFLYLSARLFLLARRKTEFRTDRVRTATKNRKLLTPLGNELFDDIIVDTNIDHPDPRMLVEMAISFVIDAASEALYRPNELPRVARWSYYVEYYACQVNNGGHGQFLHNCDQDPAILADIAAGLRAMGAKDYARLYDDFIAFLAADPVRASDVAAGCGFGDIHPAIAAFDKRFFALGSDWLDRLNSAMVRAYPALRPTPRSERLAAFARLAELNPHYAERRAVVDARIAAREATPMAITARAIAQAAGLNVRRWIRGNPPTLSIIAIDTETGPFLIKLDPDEALIYSKNGKLPWAYFDTKNPGTLITRIPLEDGLPKL